MAKLLNIFVHCFLIKPCPGSRLYKALSTGKLNTDRFFFRGNITVPDNIHGRNIRIALTEFYCQFLDCINLYWLIERKCKLLVFIGS
ncbi:hypothetical protein FHR25_005025 [Yokenella regensburgei]|nr:hypothetical protein FHR25_005025 [Yokenella regensburgei]